MSFFDEATYEEPSAQRRDDDAPLDVVSRVGTPASQGFDLAQLARLARELGPRDLAEVNRRARDIGAELGRVLDPNPKNEGTGAYYRWAVKNRDGTKGVIEGPTIGLMDALVEVWGRLVYQVEIVEERGQRVQLRARVIDLVNLIIHERPYIAHLRPPPARFASNPDESERWRVMQLQSAESKAIRGVLERVVPQSVQHLALEAAKEAAAGAQLGNVPALDGQGKPIMRDGKPVMRRATLPEAIDAAVKGLGTLTPPPDLLLVERWLGRPRSQWVASDLAALRGLYARWKRGELTPAGFAAEVAEQEAAGAGAAADEQQHENGTDGDRLSGLGLGNTASAPSPSTTSATGGSSAPAAGPAPSEGGGAAPSKANVGDDLDALIRGLEKAGGPVTIEQAKERFKAEANLQALRSARWDPVFELGKQLGRLVLVRDDARNLTLVRVSTKPDPVEELPREPDAVDQMQDAEVLDEVRALSAELAEGEVAAAFEAAGIPTLDGAPMPAVRRVLRELLKLVPGGES